jgi:two-component system nitrate/nitrite response regulator NarL
MFWFTVRDVWDDSAEGEILDVPVKPGTIRIILADSQAIYRVGIRKVFALEDDLRVVAQADSSKICALAFERYPTDIVLLEGSLLAGTANVIPDLLRVAPDVKLIVQAVSADENHTVELYRRGVRGIISRSISPDLLVRCVRRIAAGETWIDNQSVNWVIEAYRAQAAGPGESAHQPRLSPKEMAIITCITQGKRNKEIAFQLGTTEQVIKNYLRKIYDKLGVSATALSWRSTACTTRSFRRMRTKNWWLRINLSEVRSRFSSASSSRLAKGRSCAISIFSPAIGRLLAASFLYCFTASISMTSLTSSPTMAAGNFPPMPKSVRLRIVVAVKPL